jgi:hypothetical protein
VDGVERGDATGPDGLRSLEHRHVERDEGNPREQLIRVPEQPLSEAHATQLYAKELARDRLIEAANEAAGLESAVDRARESGLGTSDLGGDASTEEATEADLANL